MLALLIQLKRIYPQTTSVVDAKVPLTIEVTKEDVRRSKRKDMNNCVIAVACLRGNGKVPDFVIASRSRLYLIVGGKATRYLMTPRAVRELTSFDRGATFTPGTYILYPLPSTEKLGARKRKKRRGGQSKKPNPIRRALIDNIRATIVGLGD